MLWDPKEIDVVDYDPFSDEALDDPNPIYKRLRTESPVHFLEKYDSWALTLFEDIWQLSMDMTTMHRTSIGQRTGQRGSDQRCVLNALSPTKGKSRRYAGTKKGAEWSP